MPELRKLFIREHYALIGFIDGMKYISKKTGNQVNKLDIKNYIENGVLL